MVSLLGAAHDEGVVELRYDLLSNDALEQADVHHHTLLGVALLGRGLTLDGYEETIRVAVNLAAGAVVALERVGSLEGKLFGKSNSCHRVKSLILYKNKLFIFCEQKIGRRYAPNGDDDVMRSEIKDAWNALTMLEMTIDHVTGKEAKELMKRRNENG